MYVYNKFKLFIWREIIFSPDFLSCNQLPSLKEVLDIYYYHANDFYNSSFYISGMTPNIFLSIPMYY